MNYLSPLPRVFCFAALALTISTSAEAVPGNIFKLPVRGLSLSLEAPPPAVAPPPASNVALALTQEGYRTWADGSVAKSCKEYRTPASPYFYEGATGSGAYRVQPEGGAAITVFCDMQSDGGGWTRVAMQYEADAVSWSGGSAGGSYALTASQIPAHTQTAFGKDDVATSVDYVNFVYSTGDISKTEVVSPKTGNRFHIHRSAGSYYGDHDPESASYASDAGWMNTLTLDLVGGVKYTWSFSPNRAMALQRGFAMGGGGYRYTTSESFAWSVWVR